MDNLIISGPGFPGTNELLAFLDQAYTGPAGALGHKFGNNCVVSGVKPLPGGPTGGWIVRSGELMPFVGGSIQTDVVVIEEVTNMGYDTAGDGNFTNQMPVWKKRYAKFGTLADPGAVDIFPYADLKRVPTLEVLSATGLKLLLSGQFNYIDVLTGPDVLNVTGGLIGVVDIPTGDPWVKKFVISFPQIVGDYVPVIVKADGVALRTQATLSSSNASSLTIMVRFDKIVFPGGATYIGWFEQHLKIYLLGTNQ